MRQSQFTKYDIAFFIDRKGKTRWSHLLKEFFENESEKHISRQRLSDYEGARRRRLSQENRRFKSLNVENVLENLLHIRSSKKQKEETPGTERKK